MGPEKCAALSECVLSGMAMSRATVSDPWENSKVFPDRVKPRKWQSLPQGHERRCHSVCRSATMAFPLMFTAPPLLPYSLRPRGLALVSLVQMCAIALLPRSPMATPQPGPAVCNNLSVPTLQRPWNHARTQHFSMWTPCLQDPTHSSFGFRLKKQDAVHPLLCVPFTCKLLASEIGPVIPALGRVRKKIAMHTGQPGPESKTLPQF